MKSKQTNSKKPLSPFVSPFLSPGIQRPQDELSMDWSMDIPVTSASPLPRVPPASEHVSSPHDPLHNTGSSGNNRAESGDSAPTLLDYSKNQLVIANSWDGAFHVVSIFGTVKTWSEDAANICESIKRIGSYIKSHPADKNPPSGDFIPVVQSLWMLIDMIYTSKWDVLIFDKEASLTIRKCVKESIMPFYRKLESSTSKAMSNLANLKEKTTISNPIIVLPSTAVPPTTTTNLPVAPLPNKNIESVDKKTSKPLNMKKSYA